MDFLELAKARYSCRKLSDRPVEQELLDKIVDAAILSPTAVNNQPYKIWLVQSEEVKAHMPEVTRFTFGAPVFMVLGYQEEGAYVRKYDERNFADIDAGIVGTHMMLEVTDLGLGTTWVGHFDAPKLKELCPCMKDYELVAIFPIGYPAEEAHPAHLHDERKTREEVVEVI